MAFPTHNVTQAGLLNQLVRERPEREALIYPGRGLRMSFADLDQRSMAMARGLVALGVEAGERITLWSDNHPDWVPLQFAAARIGAILVTANTALTRDEIAYLLRQSRSCVAIVMRGMKAREGFDALEYLLRYDGVLPELRHALAIEKDAQWKRNDLEDLMQLGEAIDPERVRERESAIALDDPVNIQYTSGTTGFPKGVVLTNRNLVENAYTISQTLGVVDSDRLLLQFPLFHCFGCVVSVLGAYTHGIPLIAIDRFNPKAALEAIDTERCTIIHGVPTMFLATLQHPDFAQHDTQSLRAGVIGGAMCPEALMRRVMDEMGCEGIVVAYGLTEASPGITCSSPTDPVEVRSSTVGRAMPDISVRIVDPKSGRDVPCGQEGELWAKGPNIMQGYFENEESTAAAITDDGWLRTGDLATMDASGLVRIVGRIKEMIIRGGENISPAQVEDALRAHPSVLDAAVYGVPSEHWGEEVAAAVILKDGQKLTQEDLGPFLADRLADYKRPKYLNVLESFPLTASGKVQRFRLRELCGHE